MAASQKSIQHRMALLMPVSYASKCWCTASNELTSPNLDLMKKSEEISLLIKDDPFV